MIGLRHFLFIFILYMFIFDLVCGFDMSTCGIEKTCILNPPGCFTNVSSCAGFSYAYVSIRAFNFFSSLLLKLCYGKKKKKHHIVKKIFKLLS